MAKRKLLNLRVIGNSRQLLNQFIDNNKEYIFRETYKGIKHAIDQDKNGIQMKVKDSIILGYQKAF